MGEKKTENDVILSQMRAGSIIKRVPDTIALHIPSLLHPYAVVDEYYRREGGGRESNGLAVGLRETCENGKEEERFKNQT